ncbi:MAG: hypothetical protein E6I94_09640 [Chloroflexi bacterium]|nr:MAG: hypothetical protein E6I94_09640 [Chloroflexota bacterium]
MTDPVARRISLAGSTCLLLFAACGGASIQSASSGSSSAPPASASESPLASLSIVSAPATSAAPSQEPDVPGGNTSGDVPDNAVFLTYRSAGRSFSIKYVEGWQVTTQPDGVIIRDKDISETVQVVASPPDIGGYITNTDLPALQAQAGFRLGRRDSIRAGSQTYQHLAYHLPSAPDPVTGKQVPSTVDRYYVPGPKGLAVISLSTPDGVDNVDAFRTMIESFRWT